MIDTAEDVYAFYLRIEAQNQSGVLAEITRILAQKQINIESILQKEDHRDKALIIVITSQVKLSDLNFCLSILQEEGCITKAIRVNHDQAIN